MPAKAIDTFDELLSGSDADAMDWADGNGHGLADQLLSRFLRDDWEALTARCHSRGSKWRECLASALHPRQGPVAEQLLLRLACDSDTGVAFHALLAVMFHCGVNANASGAFLDRRIQDLSFLAAAARQASDLLPAIQRARAGSSEHFKQRLHVLDDLIRAQGPMAS